jgi:heme exporter protein CcmD
MIDFLFQGGYALYVWPAYAASALGLGALIVATLAAWHKAKRALSALQDSETNI